MFDLSMIVNICVMLLLTIMAIVLIGYLSKKYKIFVPSSGQGVELIGGTNLGKKNKIILVEVLDRKILLGVSEQQINTLCVFDTGAEISPTDLKVNIHE